MVCTTGLDGDTLFSGKEDQSMYCTSQKPQNKFSEIETRSLICWTSAVYPISKCFCMNHVLPGFFKSYFRLKAINADIQTSFHINAQVFCQKSFRFFMYIG